jgi:sortase A
MKQISFSVAPFLVMSALALSFPTAKAEAAPHFSSAVNATSTAKKATAPPPASTRKAAQRGSWLPATIIIPALGVRAPVVRGVDNAALRYGVGFDPASDEIGAKGNSVLAGHRNIWGSYFWYLPRLKRGDTVLVEARQKQFFYRVENARVVQPHETHVLDSLPGDNSARLTLYTCTKPKTECRFIVSARLYQTLDISRSPGKSRAVSVPKRPVNKRTPPPLPKTKATSSASTRIAVPAPAPTFQA